MRQLKQIPLQKPITAAERSRNAMIQLGLYFGALVALYLIASVAFASGQDLGKVAENVTGTLTSVTKLIAAASYVAGIGFALMGLFKFKAHKEQPTQVPLSQPIVLLSIAAGLVFLPSIISTAGQTIFGSSGQSGSSTGTGLK